MPRARAGSRGAARLARAAGWSAWRPMRPPRRQGQRRSRSRCPDDMHHRGIATLLLEHLVSLARRRGLQAFTAETLADNAPMLRVFADAGLPVQRRSADGVVQLTFPLPGERPTRAWTATWSPSPAGKAGRTWPALPSAPARVGRGGGRQPQARHRGPRDPAQHRAAPASRPRVRGEPARHEPWRGALRDVRGRPARAGRPRGNRVAVGAPCRRWRRSAAVTGCTALVVITSGMGSEGSDLLAICRRLRDAAGRAELLRRQRPRDRAERDVRRRASGARRRRPRGPVRRGRDRAARAPLPARHRRVLVRVGRRQVRRVQQRPADVVGAGRRVPSWPSSTSSPLAARASSRAPRAGSGIGCPC